MFTTCAWHSLKQEEWEERWKRDDNDSQDQRRGRNPLQSAVCKPARASHCWPDRMVSCPHPARTCEHPGYLPRLSAPVLCVPQRNWLCLECCPRTGTPHAHRFLPQAIRVPDPRLSEDENALR